MLEHHHTSAYGLHMLVLQKLFKIAKIYLHEVGFDIHLFVYY